MHDPRDLAGLVRDELEQRRSSGYDVRELEAAARSDAGDPGRLAALLDLAAGTRRAAGWPYLEPSAVDLVPMAGGVAAPAEDAQRAQGPAGSPRDGSDGPPRPLTLEDAIHGAWLGRCAGCLLGKPIEGWPAATVRDFLERFATLPPTDYLPAPEPWPAGYPAPKPSWPVATRGRIRGMPRDDDIDYTILGLHVLEDHGRDFTTDDVAAELLDHLPFSQTFTAERVVYANLVAGLPWPDAAAHHNPYREWIGALIRADIFGYVSPGDPATAAGMALRDARLTHDANGVYGAMWLAAAMAEALTGSTAVAAIEAGLRQVPAGSRLHEAISRTVEAHGRGLAWPEAIAELERAYGHYHWVHVIPNAAAITAALLWGGGDFGRTIGLAVAAGWDTDSAGATAGSLAGAMLGAKAIPSAWSAPLRDSVRSSISGFDGASIAALAQRTVRLVPAALLVAQA